MSDAEGKDPQGQDRVEQDPPPTGGPPTGSTPGALAELKQLGRYKILRELGRGAMGIVFEAVDPKIGRKVALKVLTSVPGVSDAELEEFRSRFFREARTAGMLAHPNIVVIHDVDHDENLGISYMAMEYLKGQTLYDLLRSGVKFTRAQTIDLVTQVAEGLDHAHRQGIIHRDVKPANLMLQEDGTLKVTDFGIAKISSSNLTRTGQFLGTPNYMSPEQVIGHVIDGRSDLFSLGIILYELLTGEKPFMGSSLTTITYQIVNVDPIEPSKIQPGIPKVFDDISARLLKKAPDERFQTGKDVAEALRAAKDGLAAGAGAPGATATPAAVGSAEETRVGELQATVAGPQLGLGASVAGAAPAVAGAPASSNNRLLLGGIAAVFLAVAGLIVVLNFMGSGDSLQPEQSPANVAGLQPPEPAPAIPPRGDPGTGSPALPGAGQPPTGTATSGAPGGTTTGAAGGTTTGASTEPGPGGAGGTGAAGTVGGGEAGGAAPVPVAVTAPERRPEPEPAPVRPAPEPAPRRTPEPEPFRLPGRAEPLPLRPTREPPKVAAPAKPEMAHATLRFEHKLKSGTLSVDVDGATVGSYDFDSDKKKGGVEVFELEMPEGSHVVRLCLDSADLRDGRSCPFKQHQFVMNTNVTIRAKHQKFMRSESFYFEIE